MLLFFMAGLPEIEQSTARHEDADQFADEEAEGPEGALVEVEDGVEDPGEGEDAEEHGGEEGAGLGEQVHGGDHEEDGYVLEVILVGSPHALHVSVSLRPLRAELLGVLGVRKGPATHAVIAGEGRHQQHLERQDGGVEGEGGEGRVVEFPHNHLDELLTLTDRPFLYQCVVSSISLCNRRGQTDRQGVAVLTDECRVSE